MSLSSLARTGADAPPLLWWDGRLVPWEEARVHVNSVGHASVSSVFEGIKAYWSEEEEELYVFRLRDHMRRLVESARIARLPISTPLDSLVEGCLALLRAIEPRRDTYIRPWTFARGVIRELITPEGTPTSLVIDTWPFDSRMLGERTCRACVSSWSRISDHVMPPRVKAFANYHNGRLATVEAKANGYDWPILLNPRGKVTEGPGSCLMLVRGDRLITPSLSSGVLESITRETFLELSRERLGMPTDERAVDRTELYVADEVFYVGTGWEILPVASIDGLTVGDGRMGPVAKRLDRLYHQVVHARDASYSKWCTAVASGESAG